MHDVEDEPLFAERVAGIDIAKAGIEVTIRVPSDTRPGRRQQETRAFGTTRRELMALADWLRSWGVTKAGMEATGDYWKPVYFVLESQGFDCQLYHAAQVKALPGRPKTDRADSVWLARITERGSLPSSFVPPGPIRLLRTHTRYRRHLTQARTAEKQRVEKLLEDGHLKLSSVISDIHGVSGRAMLEAIIAGERNPKVLAQLARGTMRGKIARLEEALDCSFLTEEHAAVLKMMLSLIDSYTAQIDELTAKIEVLAEPWLHQIGQLDAVHGTGRISAQDVIAEIGTDMTVFPAASTWCPGPDGAPRSPSPAASAKEPTPPAAATPTCPPPSARSPSAPAAPVLPRREIPPARQAHAEKESPRRDRKLRPDHLSRPALRPRRHLLRPRPRLLRAAHERPPPGPHPRPRPRTPRLPRHHRGHQPRHRRTAHRNRLTRSPKSGGAERRRTLPRAHERSGFRTRGDARPAAN